MLIFALVFFIHIMTKNKIAIIVAGGKGLRMQTIIPKQFIEILGKPVLMHTIEAFYRYDSAIQLIIVLPEYQIEFWKSLCKKHDFKLPHHIVAGGQTRYQSVKNGLNTIDSSALIAIHDGVRPFVSIQTIARCFDEADKNGSAIPVMNLEESIRRVDENRSFSVDRTSYKLVQTPQVFNSDILKKAYKQKLSPLFTDDASVVEALGEKIHLVEGNRENIKITTGFDLMVAETILNFESLKSN